MPALLICGDPHGQFDGIVAAARAALPAAVLLLGDMEAARPLHEELSGFPHATTLLWIPGNHDTEDSRFYDNLFGSELAGGNIHGRIVTVAGLRIAGLGGVFRSKVWDGKSLPRFLAPSDYLKVCGKGNQWRQGLPMRHRSSLFPSDFQTFAGLTADVLITHEAPELHEYGFNPITMLAQNLQVRSAFHGHHHQDRAYPGDVWHGVAMRQIVLYEWD